LHLGSDLSHNPGSVTVPTAIQEAHESLGGSDRTIYADTGEMRQRVHDMDWSATPLGSMSEWPQSLRTSVDIVLGSAFPQILLWGPELVQIYNDGYREIMGGKHPAGLGMASLECWPEIARITKPIHDRVLAGETVTFEDVRFPLERNGELEDVYLTLSYSPVHGDDGTVAGIFVTLLETTRRMRTAEMEVERAGLLRELEAERRRLEEVFQQAPAFLAVLRGPDHVIEFANDAYLQLVGQRDIVGKTVAEALPEMVGQGLLDVLDGVLRTGRPFAGREIPVMVQRGRGGVREERYLDFVYQPLTEVDGTRVGVVAHGSDVTEHTLARRDLELAREIAENARREAEQANRAKSEFLTTMSHELRTPLNAVAGYSDLLLMGVRGELTEAQREDLERIKRSGQYLLGLINDVLNFAKLEAGQVEFRVDELPTSQLLEGLEDLIRPQMNAKGLLYHHGDCRTDEAVRVDPEKVRQILLNLLTNAAKFTEPGGEIALSCDVDGHSVRIAVHDNGRGIAEDQLARVFDPFVQVDRHLTPQSQQGVGLGLAISRDLAIGMGGKLEAESAVGRGSTFTLTLPRSGKL
jgi:signal transduction histidine kinase